MDVLQGSSQAWPWYVLAGLAAAFAFYYALPRSAEYPGVGFQVKDAKQRKAQYSFNAPKLLQDGYDQFKDKIFSVDTSQGEHVQNFMAIVAKLTRGHAVGIKLVFPHQYVEEIAKDPGLSFHKSLDEDLLVDYTYMGGIKPFALSAFKREVIPNLGKFIPSFSELIQESVPRFLGEAEEWTPVNMYPKMLRLLGVLTSRVMVDEAAPHNETWVTLTTKYVDSAIRHAHDLKFWPAFTRPFVHRFLPRYKDIQQQLGQAGGILIKAIERFDEHEATGTPEPQPTSVLYHMSRLTKGTSSSVIDMHLKEQMNLAVGGIHTTSSVLTQTIFEMATHPEYIPELRQEALDMFRATGGVATKASLFEMHKLDSFIRESHRLNSPNLTTLQRLATQDVTLKDGTFIPKGTKLEFATCSIHRDGEFYDDASKFDGFRFYRLREADANGEGGKHRYISARKDMLGWGYGKTACPGRFLADVEIKLILSFLLLHYDLKNPEGQGRQKHIHFENQVFPSASEPVLVKAIKMEDIGADGRVAALHQRDTSDTTWESTSNLTSTLSSQTRENTAPTSLDEVQPRTSVGRPSQASERPGSSRNSTGASDLERGHGESFPGEQFPATTQALRHIQLELQSNQDMEGERREILKRALAFATQAASQLSPAGGSSPRVNDDIVFDEAMHPSASMVHSILRGPTRSTGLSFFLDMGAIISKATMEKQGLALLDNSIDYATRLHYTVNVNFAAWMYIQASSHGSLNETLKAHLHKEQSRYDRNIHAALRRFGIMDTITQSLFQALLSGLDKCWNLIATVSKVCIALGGQRLANLATTSSDESLETRYSLSLCYMFDKALAMSMNRAPCLPDMEINAEQLVPTTRSNPNTALYYIFLQLAQVQDQLLRDMRHQGDASQDVLERMQKVQQTMWRIQDKMRHFRARSPHCDERFLQVEWIGVDFAYYSIMTFVTNLHPYLGDDPGLQEQLLGYARKSITSLNDMLTQGVTLDDAHTFKISVSWLVLFYPLRPFFLLFSHVVDKSHVQDFQLLADVTSSLKHFADDESDILRVQRLFDAFVSLCKPLVQSEANGTTSGSAAPADAPSRPQRDEVIQNDTIDCGDSWHSRALSSLDQDHASCFQFSILHPGQGMDLDALDDRDMMMDLYNTQPSLGWLNGLDMP
ncbi:hypothetical protein QQZ08_008885 [Neonectria magnoliae]|uniref:Xylanolytic transcriptional activator regulatory domain-containing protein n=1 Tax=Neonectria magnoliae TaxID=2732573 RepID=A0ABR1HTC2_9HYPO